MTRYLIPFSVITTINIPAIFLAMFTAEEWLSPPAVLLVFLCDSFQNKAIFFSLSAPYRIYIC